MVLRLVIFYLRMLVFSENRSLYDHFSQRYKKKVKIDFVENHHILYFHFILFSLGFPQFLRKVRQILKNDLLNAPTTRRFNLLLKTILDIQDSSKLSTRNRVCRLKQINVLCNQYNLRFTQNLKFKYIEINACIAKILIFFKHYT